MKTTRKSFRCGGGKDRSVIFARVPPHLHRALQLVRVHQRISVSEVIRLALQEFIEREYPSPTDQPGEEPERWSQR